MLPKGEMRDYLTWHSACLCEVAQFHSAITCNLGKKRCVKTCGGVAQIHAANCFFRKPFAPHLVTSMPVAWGARPSRSHLSASRRKNPECRARRTPQRSGRPRSPNHLSKKPPPSLAAKRRQIGELGVRHSLFSHAGIRRTQAGLPASRRHSPRQAEFAA